MGWFGDQDTKTSQEPKLWKIWKSGHFNKIPKGEITVVSEHYLGTWCGLIFMSTIIHIPPLYIETENCFCWRGEKKVGEEGNFLETMTRHEKRTSYDGEELIKSMESIFEDMTKNIMK